MTQENIVSDERKIGIPGNQNFVPYYTSSSWLDAEDSFYFFSRKPGSTLHSVYLYHVETDQAEKCFEIETEANLLHSVFLFQRGLMVFLDNDSFTAVDLKTGKKEKKYPFDTRWKFDGCCISRDERYFCFGSFDGEVKEPTMVHVLDTFAPEWKEISCSQVDFLANHFQFFPNGEEILFAHEGSTYEIPDRLNVLNWKTGKARCIHPHLRDENGKQIECIGHEQVAGSKVLAVRYPDSQMEEFGILIVDPVTEEWELADQGDYWHSSSNPDGTIFVMDTMWWANSKRKTVNLIDIVLFDARKKKRHVLKTFEANPLGDQLYHSHPHTNSAGNRVLYSVRPIGKQVECHLELLLLKENF